MSKKQNTSRVISNRRITHLTGSREAEWNKKWKRLPISDRFIFSKVFRNKALCLELMRMLLPKLTIKDISIPVPEKDIKVSPDGKGIRFDIYVMDDVGRNYDIEMQILDTRELPKRSRYYAGMMDQEELVQGAHYSVLKESYVIFFCMFDLFRKGYCQYTFQGACEEDQETHLEDGMTRIFLNAGGHIVNVSPELKNFLDYMAEGTDAVPKDPFTEKVDQAVKKARRNRKWRAEAMRANQAVEDAAFFGKQDGIEIGRKDGIKIGVKREREKRLRERAQAEKKLAEMRKLLLSHGIEVP